MSEAASPSTAAGDDRTTGASTAVAAVLRVTDDARERILGLRAQEEGSEGLGLRIEVTGVQGVEYTYDLSFDPVDDAEPDDSVSDDGGLPVIVPAGSVDRLRGATLDVPSGPGQGGLVLRNPNRPDPLAGDDIELTGTVEEQVTQLLDQRINPALAAHGGFATLVRVEDDKVFVTMGGGCQGCAVSAMTLRDGIASSIKSSIPEVTEVIDVTDHDAGENPFY
jgi:Fe/S biogenesis protein NfuA